VGAAFAWRRLQLAPKKALFGRKPIPTVKLDGDQLTVVVVHGLVVLSVKLIVDLLRLGMRRKRDRYIYESGKNRFSMAGSSNG